MSATLCGIELHVPHVAASLAQAPPGQPPYDLLVVDLEIEDDVEHRAEVAENGVELVGLGDGAREAVEQEAALGVVLAEPVADHRDE